METPLAWEFLKLILGEERLDIMVHIPQNGLKYNSYHVLGRLFTRITSSLILHQNLNDGLLFPSQMRKVGFNKKKKIGFPRSQRGQHRSRPRSLGDRGPSQDTGRITGWCLWERRGFPKLGTGPGPTREEVREGRLGG